jgi:hypothetical protein
MPVIATIRVESETPLEMPILGVTTKSSLLVQKVTGLNPPDRSLFIGDYSQDGGLYQGRRVGSRNVVFMINLNPNPALGETVSSLRQILYKSFIDPQVDGDYLKVVLVDEDGNEKYLVGYCEKFESDLFDVETLCQISMVCPDPYIRANQASVYELDEGWISFPYIYEGTAETGFEVRIYMTANANNVTLYNNGKVMQLNNTDGYKFGDIILINTSRGQRSIHHMPAASITAQITDFASGTAYGVGSLVFYNSAVWKATNTVPANGAIDGGRPGSSLNNYWGNKPVSIPIMSHLKATSEWIELHSDTNTVKVYQGNSWTSFVGTMKYLKYTAAYWGM